jgi:hypothetical protein
METTNNKVVFRQNGVDDIAFISTHVEGEYVEACVTRPRSAKYSHEELLDALQEQVWWANITSND